MVLIDGYIRMLRIFLPKEQRDDIVRELEEEIHAQAADMQAGLGRPLNTDEQAELLRKYGHPLLTAARYRPQGYLIGPIIFPYWWLALRVILALVVIGQSISVVLGDLSWARAGEAAVGLAQDAGMIVAWFTLLGAAADRLLVKSRVLETWDPKRLPVVRQPVGHAARTASFARRAGVHHHSDEPASLTGLVIGVVLSVWWLLALRFPYLMFGPGADTIEWGPAMLRIYPVLFVAQLATLVESYARFARPGDLRLFRFTRPIWFVAGLALILVMVTVDYQWVVWRDGAGATSPQEQFSMTIANMAFSIAFSIAALGAAVSIVKQVWRVFWGGGQPPSTAVAR